MRNRVIAGLVDLVVVVESHARGGSLITAEAAIERGVEVKVVPGPVNSPASEGSNQLLYDGPGPVRHARDVLDALGVFLPDPPAGQGETGRRRSGPNISDPNMSGPNVSGRNIPSPVGPSTGRPGPVTAVPAHPTVSRQGPGRSGGQAANTREGGTGALGGGGMPPARIPGELRRLLDSMGWRPVSLNQAVELSGGGPGDTLRGLERLASLDMVSSERGWWTRIR